MLILEKLIKVHCLQSLFFDGVEALVRDQTLLGMPHCFVQSDTINIIQAIRHKYLHFALLIICYYESKYLLGEDKKKHTFG